MKLPQLDEFRQSTLRAIEVCPRRTKHSLAAGDIATGWTEGAADLGTVFHAVAAEMMATLRRQGEAQMATEEAVVIAREVYAASPITLSAEDHDALNWMVLGFCKYKWRPERTLAIEEPLRIEVVCPDGVVRVAKGQPDLVIADPPKGLVVVDYKTTRAKPRAPREAPAEGEPIRGKEYLTDVGTFQRQFYGFLLLRSYPSVEYVTLRELLVRYPEEPPREATLQRSDLEHVEPRIGTAMMKLDDALSDPESDFWRPKPGRQCNKCEVARSCPIPVEQRGDGALETQEDADALAQVYVVSKALYSQAASQLKAWEEAGNPPGRVNDREEVRWEPPVGKGRRFGLNERRAA